MVAPTQINVNQAVPFYSRDISRPKVAIASTPTVGHGVLQNRFVGDGLACLAGLLDREHVVAQAA
jgi:hypothetical protein